MKIDQVYKNFERKFDDYTEDCKDAAEFHKIFPKPGPANAEEKAQYKAFLKVFQPWADDFYQKLEDEEDDDDDTGMLDESSAMESSVAMSSVGQSVGAGANIAKKVKDTKVEGIAEEDEDDDKN